MDIWTENPKTVPVNLAKTSAQYLDTYTGESARMCRRLELYSIRYD
jgi:hypothetical protein